MWNKQKSLYPLSETWSAYEKRAKSATCAIFTRNSNPNRYGSLHLDCRLKTHLAVPPVVNPGQHYDDPLLNPMKDRIMPAWQASQLWPPTHTTHDYIPLSEDRVVGWIPGCATWLCGGAASPIFCKSRQNSSCQTTDHHPGPYRTYFTMSHTSIWCFFMIH